MRAYAETVEHEAHRRLRQWRVKPKQRQRKPPEFFTCSVWRAKIDIWAANRDYGRQIGRGT